MSSVICLLVSCHWCNQCPDFLHVKQISGSCCSCYVTDQNFSRMFDGSICFETKMVSGQLFIPLDSYTYLLFELFSPNVQICKIFIDQKRVLGSPYRHSTCIHVTLKQHRNDPFHVASMQNTRGVFLGHPYIYDRTFLRKTLTNKHSMIDT